MTGRHLLGSLAVVPILTAIAALSAASAEATAHSTPADITAPCLTTWLRPPPCPLWYWVAPSSEEAAREGPVASGPDYQARHDVTRTAAGVVVIAAAIAAATLVDTKLRPVVAAENPDRPATISDLGNLLGNGRVMFLATSATYGLSRLVGYDELADPAGRVLAALVTAGVVNGSLKVAVGRGRPRLEMGSSEFRPLALTNGWQSFPSGHAVTAFALATAIAAETDQIWVTGLSYGAAGLVAWSRGHEDRHWMSDVMAGAAVGTIVARYTTRRLNQRASRAEPSGRVRLLVGPATLGLTVPLP